MTTERPPKGTRLDVHDTQAQERAEPESDRPIPLLISGIDIRQLPIGPEEAFVLSRVDGQATTREIGHATSLSEAQVNRCLARLEALAAITYDNHPKQEKRPSRGVSLRPSSAPRSSAPPTLPFSPSEPPLVPLYDVAELDAPADLELERKRDVLELYYRLDSRDHYQLLGVPPNADRRAIKAAYYDKVSTFHPDRYFGKNLGTFGPKLDQCFARLTIAHDTLTSADKRKEYDDYLAEQIRAAELERALSQTITFDDLDLLEQKLHSLVRQEPPSNPASPTETRSIPPQTDSISLSPASSTIELPPADGQHTSSPVPKMSDEDRKRQLARKLRASTTTPRAPPKVRESAPSPQSSIPPSRQELAQQLRRNVGGFKREDLLKQLQTALAKADAATSANDPAAAANALRMAQALAPNDPAIAERLSRTQDLAAASLSDTYLRQAEYEEKSGRFEAASRSFERAARGKPSALLWESAARCALECGHDLKKAAEFARLSIAIDPERAASHFILGRVFLTAGMRSSAIAELERARRLDPNNDTVGNLLERITNDGV
jgi:curved DNA-binding protein CbpA